MNEPKRPAPSTAPTSPDSNTREDAQRAARKRKVLDSAVEGTITKEQAREAVRAVREQRAARKVSGKLEDRLREWIAASERLSATPADLRRVANALEAARELCDELSAEFEPVDGKGVPYRYRHGGPWARLRTLLGEEGEQ